MQSGSIELRHSIDICLVLTKELNYIIVSLIACEMEWGPVIECFVVD